VARICALNAKRRAARSKTGAVPQPIV
jgi:hypothetical protein